MRIPQPEPKNSVEADDLLSPTEKFVETNKPKEYNLMSQLQTPPKEPTVRFTVDLPETMHRKLSVMAAKTGRKKADIVRFLLNEALKE